jgi:RNA polymerase sigma-70 factor (ECF subfamily)
MHLVPSHKDTEKEFAQSQRLSTAREALLSLDDDKREIFVLAQIEEMSAPEIADITGLPVNTVYSRLRAARTAFSAEIQRLEASQRRHT